MNLDSLKDALKNVHTEDLVQFIMPAVGGVAGGLGGNLLTKKKKPLARVLSTLLGAAGGAVGGVALQNATQDFSLKSKLNGLGDAISNALNGNKQ